MTEQTGAEQAAQQGKIQGYRKLSAEEIDLINELKEQGNNLGAALQAIGSMPTTDQRCLAIAVTHFQTAQMWLIRSIAKPEGF